ncbi:ankyrin repeat domain-containing protein [Pedobacter sandarakinus]|uniref:ankyrin repeat domain-containing protein n=1 Tax=Pedobacter sandarakinus TaxID=353156 RepID=UPI002245B5F2|nr:ankyrin repeat domain-containing protein [Pedobacter sandarakinus]MCX2575869.1 ankyrin repeat domain-containing protein [Pedobacter sandarakinus]
MIRKFLFTILAMSALGVQAQKNVFFDPAFWKGNPDLSTIKSEVEKGNSPSQLNPMSFDAAVYAINNGASAASILYLLAQKGNDVNKITHDSRTYLFWAASKGNIPVVEYLLKNGAKVNLQDSHGATPLTFAAGAGQADTKVYDLLLANGADLKKELNHDGANALLIGIANDKDFKLTDYFVAKGLSLNSVDAAGNTAFNYAAKTGNIETMNRLIAKGVKYNDNAFIMAAQGGRGSSNTVATYQYLEGLKLKPTALGSNGENALFYIVRKPNQDEVINYFLSKGVDVNQADKDGNTPFIAAAGSSKSVPTLTLLAKSLKNIDQQNAKGASALSMAVRNNSAEIVAFLVNKGAKLDVVDLEGNNLAYYLFQSYSPRTIEDFDAKLKMLTDNGLNVSEVQPNGNTLYHLAVAKNDIALAKLLATYKIDVNLKNKEGYTPLHKAAMTAKDTDLMKYLLTIGAKKDVGTDFKETPYDLASENEFLSQNKISIDFLK